MGDKIELKLDERTVHGKKVAKLRREGIIPGIVYGGGDEPVSVMAASGVLEKVYREAGKHHPVHLTVGSKRRIAMIKDVDIDPVKHRLRHVSFHAVKQNETVEAEVPIKLVGEGESAAERAGLIVLQTLEALKVKALPLSLPDQLEVSIVELAEPGQHVTVADIRLPEGVELQDVDNANELVIASVYEPSALQAANDAAGGDADDVSAVGADNGGDTDQDSQAEESRPGGKGQDEPKQSNVDANK